MAGKGKPKTGGRRKGSLNIGPRSLGRKRDRVRRDATVAITEAMPQLRKWLAAPETWKSDGAQAARMLDGLLKWIMPAYGKIDPHAEQAEETAAAQQAELPPVTPESVLTAFKGLGAVKSALAGMLARADAEEAAAVQEALPELGRLSETESQTIRHSGIPLEGGQAYLPKVPPMPKRREPGAMPELPKPAIDVQPETGYLTKDEIYRAQCRPLPDDDGSTQVVVTPAGPVVRPRW